MDRLRRRAEGGLDRLREGLLAQTLAQVQSTALVRPIRRAAQEAAALAWMEEFPLLVFPCLFQEKVDAAKHRAQRQLWVEAKPLVHQGGACRLFTSAGISAGIDLSLHLVAELAGPELARRTARQMDYDWRAANGAVVHAAVGRG